MPFLDYCTSHATVRGRAFNDAPGVQVLALAPQPAAQRPHQGLAPTAQQCSRTVASRRSMLIGFWR